MSKETPDTSSWLLRTIFLSLAAAVLMLQFSLWLGDFGVFKLQQLENTITAQQRQNDQLAERNRRLEAEVVDLKRGTAALEERARSRLGMIMKDETFYQILEDDSPGAR